MCLRPKITSILIVLACLVSAKKHIKVKHGPSGLSFSDNTNCTEFSKFGRFNPYSVLRDKWFVFYYWDSLRPLTAFFFTAPSANHTKYLKILFEGNCILPVMWQARQVLMEDNTGTISLLVERSDRGEYWLYPVGRVKPGQKITPRDIRLKQTGDNRILGLMDCMEESLLVMARINDVPRKGHLHETASRLGYRGRKGKSYLYQGHEWGPVGEADEDKFWDRRPRKDEREWKSAEESSEERSEEVELLPINKPKEKKSKARISKAVLPPVDVDGEQCIKVEPELWNDPKPNPNPDNLRITKKELDDMDINGTVAIEPVKDSAISKQENYLETEITTVNDKPVNHQEILKTEMPINDLESRTENSDLEKENCDVCFQSTVSYMPTNIPDRTEPNTEVPRAAIPQDEVPRTEVFLTEGLNEEVNLPEVRLAEVPGAKVPGDEEPFSEVPRSKATHPEAPYGEVPRTDTTPLEVPHAEEIGTGTPRATEEVPRPELPNSEIPRKEVPHVEVPSPEVPKAEVTSTDAPRIKLSRAKIHAKETHAKVAARSTAPPQDLTNSSGIIILTAETLDDIKI